MKHLNISLPVSNLCRFLYNSSKSLFKHRWYPSNIYLNIFDRRKLQICMCCVYGIFNAAYISFENIIHGKYIVLFRWSGYVSRKHLYIFDNNCAYLRWIYHPSKRNLHLFYYTLYSFFISLHIMLSSINIFDVCWTLLTAVYYFNL